MSLVHQIVSEVADREGVDPLALETPLNEAVDPDTLEEFVGSPWRRTGGPEPVMEFEYYGYPVSVDTQGNVDVGEADATTEVANSALAPLSAQANQRTDALKEVTDVVAARERPFEQRLDGVLAVVRKTLDVDAAALSYVDSGAYTFEAVDTAPSVDLQAGEVVPTADTACRRVVESEQALVTRDLAADAPELTESEFDVLSYLGVPVFVDGDVYGTFCFFDSETRDESFTDWDRSLVELLSKWVGSELEQRNRERALHASTTERPYSRC